MPEPGREPVREPAAQVLDARTPGAPGSETWLRAETGRLLGFAAGAAVDERGFGWLDDAGQVDPTRPVELWITCRMTHCFALAVLDGRPSYAGLLEHGVQALEGPLRDRQFGGWHASLATDTSVPDAKGAYEHAFVVLAAASATLARHPRAPALLADALALFEDRFVGPEGLVVDSWDRAFGVLDPYRGVNANMHAVEAFLAAADATSRLGDHATAQRCRDRATVITERVVHEFAAGYSWRLPEHYDPDWNPLPDYNRDQPADPFRPYGATIGHWLEWARLAVQLREALGASGSPSWLLDDARALTDAAAREGWQVDGASGFVYTVDFDGHPVVHERMHWVVAEAVGTAASLWQVSGDERYLDQYAQWWRWIEDHLVDRSAGSWRHELDRLNQPSASVWPGKPDVYHALQATILPRLPLAGSIGGAFPDPT